MGRGRLWSTGCRELEELAEKLDALAHPLRLRIVAYLYTRGEAFLAEIARALGVSRALAKVHLKKLEAAGIVVSRTAVEEGRAVAHRYYALSWRGVVQVSPELLVEILRRCGSVERGVERGHREG